MSESPPQSPAPSAPLDPSPERRGGERQLACFPSSIERGDGEPYAAIIRDLSESGVLLFVRTTTLAVGDSLQLHLYIAEDAATARTATGKVVRIEELPPGSAGPWLARAAVRFDEPLAVEADEIEALRSRVKRLGLGP
ncbi:MAG: PilZ domain-containing protein [Polyangiaceae bacterium]